MKKSLFSMIFAIAIAMPNLSLAQQPVKPVVKETSAQGDTMAMFFIFKTLEATNDIRIQLQQDAAPVVVEAGYFTEGKNGELIPVPEAEAEKKRAKLIAMNWGDLPKENDSTVAENRIRGLILNDHPLVWPINGGKGGYQMEVIVIRKGGSGKGAKPVNAFMDLKKAMPNKLKDGTTYQIFVSDTVKNGKLATDNKTAFYYSAYEKNFSFDNTADKNLIDCKKVVPVRIHAVKISKKGLLIDAKPDPKDKNVKYIVTAWGRNTMEKPGEKKPGQKSQYFVPTAPAVHK